MHQLLHGIRRTFLSACGGSFFACLPALALLEDADNLDLRHDGDNGDLLPPINGHQEDYGVLPPQSGAAADNLDLHDEGDLLPISNGAIEADNGDLLPSIKGPIDEDKAAIAAVNIDQQHEDNKGNIPHQEIATEQQPFGYEYIKFCVQTHMLKHIVADMDDGSACFCHLVGGDIVQLHAWVMPIPQPRVKMKADLQQHDTHAWKHDAWVSSTSPSDSSIPIHLADANVFQAYQWSLHFTPLRGRNRCQAREMKDEVSTGSKPKTKTKIMLTQMRLSYITKDVLDPG